jgi:hypothetical protein
MSDGTSDNLLTYYLDEGKLGSRNHHLILQQNLQPENNLPAIFIALSRDKTPSLSHSDS